MVYGVLLLIKMKNSSSSRSRSSSRSSSRATSPTRPTGSCNAPGPDPPQGKGRRPLSWCATPVSSLCDDALDSTPDPTLQPRKTKSFDKSPCFSTSPHVTRRKPKHPNRSRSSSGSSSRTGSPTATRSKRSTTVTAQPEARTPTANPASQAAASAAMTRDQRIRKWLQGLKQDSLEASIPEEDLPGKEESHEDEVSNLPCATQDSSLDQETSALSHLSNENGCIIPIKDKNSK